MQYLGKGSVAGSREWARRRPAPIPPATSSGPRHYAPPAATGRVWSAVDGTPPTSGGLCGHFSAQNESYLMDLDAHFSPTRGTSTSNLVISPRPRESYLHGAQMRPISWTSTLKWVQPVGLRHSKLSHLLRALLISRCCLCDDHQDDDDDKVNHGAFTVQSVHTHS
jgi:hypothetical protein